MTLWATFDNAAWRSIQVISCWKSILWWSPWSGCNNPRFLVEIYGGFPINGGTPKTLDSLFHGKSINGWWLGVLPWLRKPPNIYINFWSLYIYIHILLYKSKSAAWLVNSLSVLGWLFLRSALLQIYAGFVLIGTCWCSAMCIYIYVYIYMYIYIYVMFVFFRHVITYSITTPKTWA